jgi:hypothetical protein
MERMMKVQDVLLKAMAKKITWWADGTNLIQDKPDTNDTAEAAGV